jgi:alkaline phosphatase
MEHPSNSVPISRRNALVGLAASTVSIPAYVRSPRNARNLIVIVADGMSASVPNLYQYWREIHQRGDSVLARWQRRKEVQVSSMDTRVLNSRIPDSAAAATAWGSGVHVWGGSVNTLSDGRSLTPLWRILKERGFRTGLVTTATTTHATPAGFAAISPSRGNEAEIAESYLAHGVDVIFGGGEEFYSPELLARYRERGYEVVQHASNLRNRPQKGKRLGLFGTGLMPYEVDRKNDASLLEIRPSLRSMSLAALTTLAGDSAPFALMIEAARIDHAGHANDLAAMMHDMDALDETLALVETFTKDRNDTLVLFMSDHGCGNPSHSNGNILPGQIAMSALGNVRTSFEHLARSIGPEALFDWKGAIATHYGLKLESELAELLQNAESAQRIKGLFNAPLPTFYLGMALNARYGVGWGTGSHTSDPMPVLGWGPGIEQLPAMLMNTDMFHIMLNAIGTEFRNPSLTLEESVAYRKKNAVHTTHQEW